MKVSRRDKKILGGLMLFLLALNVFIYIKEISEWNGIIILDPRATDMQVYPIIFYKAITFLVIFAVTGFVLGWIVFSLLLLIGKRKPVDPE